MNKKLSASDGQDPVAQAAPEGQDRAAETAPLPTPERRAFLGKAGKVTAALLASSLLDATVPAKVKAEIGDTPFGPELPLAAANRCKKSYDYRTSAAKMARLRQLVFHQNNGDEDRYPNKIGSYSKALPHNQLG